MSGVVSLNELIHDVHAAREDLITFERKYGVLTETFYEAYQRGEEPEDDAWVLDWSEWAGTYEILMALHERYRGIIQILQADQDSPSLSRLIGRTARHVPLANGN